MKKREELNLSDSCLNRADMDELIFVLLARDIAATVAVAAWIEARIASGKNRPSDAQIIEAWEWIEQVRR